MIEKQILIDALKKLDQASAKQLIDVVTAELTGHGRISRQQLRLSEISDICLKVQELLEKTGKKNLKAADEWLTEVISAIDVALLRKTMGISNDLISMAVKLKLPKLSNYLVDNEIGLEADIPNEMADKHYSPLFCVLENEKGFDQALFDKLLSKTKDINHTSGFGQTALYIAIEQKNTHAIDAILARPDIQIKGRFLSLTLFDLAKRDNALYEKLVKRLNETFNAEEYNWETFLDIPIAALNEEHQEILYKKLFRQILKLDVFQDDPDLRDKFIAFLNNTTPLNFKRLDRLAIAFECVSYLTNYLWINQHKSNLCGVAVLMQHLVVYKPDVFVMSVMEIANLGVPNSERSNLPARVKSLTQDNRNLSYNLAGLWMEAIRNSYNVLLGYSSEWRFEKLYGLTTPYQLSLMFNDFNLSFSKDTFQIRIDPEMRFGSYLETARGLIAKFGVLPAPFKIYGAKHLEWDDDKQFEEFVKFAMVNENSLIPILIDKDLVATILGKPVEKGMSGLGVEDTHYLHIVNFSLSEDESKVKFTYVTFGLGFEIEVPTDIFKKGFRGAYYMDFPKVEEELPLGELPMTRHK